MTPFRRLIERAANLAAWREIAKEATMTDECLDKVVLCRDCIYWQDAEPGVVEIPICERLTKKHNYGHKETNVELIGDDRWFAAGPKDYCSFGERRNGGQNDR